MRAKVLSRPELDPESEPYFEAFQAVTRDRPIVAGAMTVVPLPVPRDLIERYCRRIGIDEGEILEFVEIVARVDDDFVKLEAGRARSDLGKPNSKS